MESAIPDHLQCPRTRHRRIPDDYAPPYPTAVARYKPDVKQMVMAYFGAQYLGESLPNRVDKALMSIASAFGNDKVPAIGIGRCTLTKPASPTSFPSATGTFRPSSMRGSGITVPVGPTLRL